MTTSLTIDIMSAALAPYIEKLDAALAEKNVVTDYLNMAQEKTGLPKRNIVLGELITFLLIFLVVSILPYCIYIVLVF